MTGCLSLVISFKDIVALSRSCLFALLFHSDIAPGDPSLPILYKPTLSGVCSARRLGPVPKNPLKIRGLLTFVLEQY